MQWLRKIIKETIHEVEEEMFADIDSDIDFDELDKNLDNMLVFDPEPLSIPIELRIDGKEPEPITDDVMQKLISLAKNDALRGHLERYLGKQFKTLALTPEGDAANLLRGKIFGASELYKELLNYEFEAQEGIEQDTMEPDGADVDPS